jgi:cysteine desulfurase/selenocysteine lyase
MPRSNSLSAAPNLQRYRADFPLLKRRIEGRPVIYLDSAATALRPQKVIDEVLRFYTECTANVHRAVHRLSEEATEGFEEARDEVARFIGAEAREIAFVRHATEALNLVARSLPEGAVIAVPDSEHHSNLLPWRRHQVLRLGVDDGGSVVLAPAVEAIRNGRPNLLTFSPVGNALGTRQPVAKLVAAAREAGASVMLDVSQCIGHEPLDVQELGCDYLCFSGHKMMGPGGVGVLYARGGMESSLRPLLEGGSMALNVGIDDHEPQSFPWSLEAGTPNIEGVLGLAAACRYLNGIGLEAIERHGKVLGKALRVGLATIPRLRIHGGSEDGTITSFTMDGLKAHGVARLLSNRHAIMVRSGYHCAQPLHETRGLPETIRISTHLYNTTEEIEACLEAIRTIARMP